MSSKPWGQPHEINRSAIPMPISSQSPYEDLFTDIAMRLEQTNGSKALLYPFESARAAKGAAISIANLFARRIGKKCVVVRAGVDGHGNPALYVMRGPNYTT